MPILPSLRCLEDNDFAAYLDACLSAEEIASLEAHLDACAECRRQASRLAVAFADDDDAATATLEADAMLAGALAMPSKASVGRYVLREALGAGNMGLVYRATDPELDRQVAIKILRPDLRAKLGDEGHLRLRREAQALAQLSHPNVVAVHDVGVDGERLFIAMEFVEGQTLGEWARTSERSWQERLRVCIDAGRGLVAAHARGIVHRDFKPDNVLVRSSDDAVVTDFGLAGSGGETSAHAALEQSASAEPVALTQTGVVIGTPVYLAPERFRGEAATPASDQFAFCVTTFEILYGTRPFRGSTIPEIAAAVAKGELQLPEEGEAWPRSLRDALARGLHPDASQRYPSMQALLADLQQALAPRTGSRRIAMGAAILVALGVLAFLFLNNDAAALCTSAPALWEEAWSPGDRASLDAVAHKAGFPEVYRRLAADLDDYGQRWQSVQTQACKATRIDQNQSDSLMDLRMQCLASQRVQVAALVASVRERKGSELAKVSGSVAALPPPELCSDLERLQAQFPMPDEPKRKERIDELERDYAQARALYLIGSFAEARPLAEKLSEATLGVEYPPLRARAHLLVAELELDVDPAAATASAEQAAKHAAVAKDDDLLAQAQLIRLAAMGTHLGRAQEAFEQLFVLEAAVARAGDQVVDVARLERLRAILLEELGRPKEAVKSLSDARERLSSSPHSSSMLMAEIERSTCRSLATLGELVAALEACSRAQTLLDGLLGPEHPQTANARLTLGTILGMLGRSEEALPHFEAALATLKAAMGAEHPSLSPVLSSLGNVRQQQGRLLDAVELQNEALRVARRGDNIGDEIGALSNLCSLHHSLGNAQAAVDYGREAVERSTEAAGPEHPQVAIALLNVASSYLLAGDLKGATSSIERGRRIAIASLGPEHPLALDFEGVEGDIDATRGDHKAALVHHLRVFKGYGDSEDPERVHSAMSVAEDYAHLGDRKRCAESGEAALSLLSNYGNHPRSARFKFELARCLGERTRAQALAREALAEVEAGLKLSPASVHLQSLRDPLRAFLRSSQGK